MLIAGWALGLQHPQTGPTGPPGAQPLLGHQVPATQVLGVYFIPQNVAPIYVYMFYFPLSKAVVNLDSESQHLRR